MKAYHGGQWAPRGYYVERKSWKTLGVPKPGRLLDGTTDSTYIRLPIPPLVMALLGPLVGALYVILLPLIGALALIWVSASKVWKSMAIAADRRPVQRKEQGNGPLHP